MITGRFAAPGKTRTCPHCRATILDSATVCPGCQHHLRFDSSGATQRVQPAATPLRVEGTLRHPANGAAWEYSVVLAIRNERGEEIARQVVGVGALQPGDTRTFSLAVELFKPAELRESKPQPSDTGQRAATDSKSAEIRAPGRPGLPPPRPTTPLADSKPAGARPAGTAPPPPTPPKWPAAAPSGATSGRYPAVPAPASAPGKAPAAASPPPAAPSRLTPAQPLRPPQAPGPAPQRSGGVGAAPGRGPAPGINPKR